MYQSIVREFKYAKLPKSKGALFWFGEVDWNEFLLELSLEADAIDELRSVTRDEANRLYQEIKSKLVRILKERM